MVSGRPQIPRRRAELTVAAVGGNLSKSSKTTVSGTISLKAETAFSSLFSPASRDEDAGEEEELAEARIRGIDRRRLKLTAGRGVTENPAASVFHRPFRIEAERVAQGGDCNESGIFFAEVDLSKQIQPLISSN
jgi:hypothetical protein